MAWVCVLVRSRYSGCCQRAARLRSDTSCCSYSSSQSANVHLELDLSPRLPEPEKIPCVFEWIQSQLAGGSTVQFPVLVDVYAMAVQPSPEDVPSERRWETITPRTLMFRRLFRLLRPTSTYVEMVEAMHACGFTAGVLDSLPEAVLIPFQDAISKCQAHPPLSWSPDLLDLVNRSDVSMALKPSGSQRADWAAVVSPPSSSLCLTSDLIML
jgi:anaphase-promoting complex subunit 1